MELFHIDLSIHVCVSHRDEFAEFFLIEGDAEDCEYHFKLHMGKYAVAVRVKSRKGLLDIDSLFLQFWFQGIS